MDLGLTGKTVIVTGASGGIGRGLVQAFADESCNVVLASRDEAKCEEVAATCENRPGKTRVVQTDVTDTNSVSALLAKTEQAFGAVDVLVNNAGGVAYPRVWEEKPADEIQWEIDLNVLGVVNCTNAIGATMIERGAGSIVNITSNSALEPSAGNMVANYAGTKGYVMSMSKALAYEWGPKGVRINCVSPGWIVPWEEEHVGEGSFWRKYGYEFFGTPEQMAAAAEGEGDMFNVQGQPIRRIGRPEDIADASLFLASERAKHLTGQLISVSGGAYMP
ncbi:MAG: SDR family NAD(P)-dependent oxidoreductase [Myxococcota bacterium]|nr:SDR family NAD(P)-dependent oxidoreductase [Myxococcota bacterium]